MRRFTLLKITYLFSVSSVTGTGFQEHNNYYKYLRTARRSSLEPREYNKVVQMILFVILFNKPLSSDISYIPVSSSSQSSSSAGSQVEGRNFILQKLCELGLGEVNMNFVKFQFVIATIKHVTVIEPKIVAVVARMAASLQCIMCTAPDGHHVLRVSSEKTATLKISGRKKNIWTWTRTVLFSKTILKRV